MSFQEIELQGAGGTLAAKRWHGQGVPVLAVHGWLDNAATFDGLAPLLNDCDLVCLDWPGHGLSYHRPQGSWYHFIDWIPEIFSAADSLGWERFCLLGHSLGAAVSAVAAGTLPDRIDRMVLIEGIGPFANPNSEAPEQLRKAMLHRLSNKKLFYPTRESALKRLLARDLAPHSAESLASRALRETEEGWYFDYAPGAKAPSRQRLSEEQVRAFLSAISCPSLLIEATDGLQGPESFQGREDLISSLVKLTIEGRHHLHLDHPERVAAPILAHLTS